MSLDTTLVYAAKNLLLPPGGNLLLLALALLLGRRLRVLGMVLFWLAVLSLYLLATPFVANRLMLAVQPVEALDLARQPDNPAGTAIVVLAGGRRAQAPEYEGLDTVSTYTLERLRYAARLQRQTKLPILLSGGQVFGKGTSEAVLMNEALISDFRGAPHWLETDSRNTAENAIKSAEILRRNGVNSIYLVTHAFHMSRARQQFEQTGLRVIPAPCSFVTLNEETRLHDFLPNAAALQRANLALHEMLGMVWYRLVY